MSLIALAAARLTRQAHSMLSKLIAALRRIAYIEGWSYLVLLFVAMPLKYAAGMPLAVRVVGSVHGALFVALMIWIARTMSRGGRSLGWGALLFLAAIVPFGTFIADRALAREEHAARELEAAADNLA